MTDYGADYLCFQTSRSRLRKWVRSFYITHAIRHCRGPTIDVGCGPGEILRRLPAGSVGLEVNPDAIRHCLAMGLQAEPFAGGDDGFLLHQMDGRNMHSLLCAHVLEHLPDPRAAAIAMLTAGTRLGLDSLVFIVPGRVGFRSDPTHRHFVDAAMFRSLQTEASGNYTLAALGYFPGNARWIGDVFIYHELMAVFHRRPR